MATVVPSRTAQGGGGADALVGPGQVPGEGADPGHPQLDPRVPGRAVQQGLVVGAGAGRVAQGQVQVSALLQAQQGAAARPCHGPVEARVHRSVDLAHAAGADRLDDLVRAKLRSLVQRHDDLPRQRSLESESACRE